MGYSEIYCHLCGVSFNIARRRKPGEPDVASWDYNGQQSDYPGVDEVDLESCARNGCFAVISYPKDKDDNVLEDPDNTLEDPDDMLEDPDYVPPDEGDYGEPEEYDSEYESADSTSISEEGNSDTESDVDNKNQHPEVDCYSDWVAKTLNPQARFPGEPVGIFGDSNKRHPDESVFPIATLSEEYDPEELGHIPSRTCTEANAYSGFAISPEEMIGCRTAQCLVHKSAIQEPSQPVDLFEPWGDSEDWFLSGLCDGIPSRDCHYPYVWPAQGGVDQPRAENVNFDPEWTPSEDWAMPFHPWCFDIFCRQSKARFNRINISGLIKWRNAEFSYEDFHGFPRSGDVFEGQEQFWHHVPGREYLAANPLYVPGLRTFLLNAGSKEVGLSRDRMEECKLPKTDHTASQVGHDVFASMLPEIRLLLVGYLDASDLHNLRLASKAFTSLPNSVWRRLVREEMPWLWESWHDSEEVHVPSFWTTVTPNDLIPLKEERERYSAQLSDVYTPTSKVVEFLLPLPKEVPDQLKLSRGNTNWHGIYTQIKKNWSSLMGLRNRERIWADVEEIIQRIEKYETQT